MAKKLYVGGLPYSATDEELKSKFSEFGSVVSANIITDKFTGRSRGFGFVEMENDEEAQNAIEKLNGSDFGGRNLTVNEARPLGEKAPRKSFGGGRRGFGGGRGEKNWQ